MCVKHTGQTGIPGADDEHAKPQGEGVHPETLGRDLGVVDRAEGAPGAAVDEVAGQPEPDDDDGGQQEEVLLGCVVNPAAERDVGQTKDAGRATGELLLGDEHPDDDAQAEGGQREEVAAQPQQRQPHEEGDEHGRDDRDRRRDLALEQRVHTRTAEVLPAKPLGRKSSTRTRTTKATASR